MKKDWLDRLVPTAGYLRSLMTLLALIFTGFMIALLRTNSPESANTNLVTDVLTIGFLGAMALLCLGAAFFGSEQLLMDLADGISPYLLATVILLLAALPIHWALAPLWRRLHRNESNPEPGLTDTLF